MIQNNELRIGNYFLYNGKIQVVTPHTYNAVFFDECDGIPLTPSIMSACGFVHANGVYRLEDFIIKNDFTELYCPGEKGAMEKSFFVQCQYLHQLQNLYFALEYEELVVKL